MGKLIEEHQIAQGVWVSTHMMPHKVVPMRPKQNRTLVGSSALLLFLWGLFTLEKEVWSPPGCG